MAADIPRLECDLVMKGGVTSGIVYPPALMELKAKYRFNSIGGTSAGAIAAAAAAAAEYARHTGGFERFRDLSASLSQGDALFNLFKPPPETVAIVDIMRASGVFGGPEAKKGLVPIRVVGAVLRYTFWWAGLLGAVLGLLLGGLLSRGIGSVLSDLAGPLMAAEGVKDLGAGLGVLLILLTGVTGGMLGGLSYLVFHVLLNKIPHAHFFGIVNGHDPRFDGPPPARSGSPPAPPQAAPTQVTDWLSVHLDAIAGLAPGEQPLTFGRLCDKGITLRMIATNVSNGIPYTLPFADQTFIFSAAEMGQFFPAYVVTHMVTHAHPPRNLGPIELPPGYHFLPKGDDLPVVVATRMSLAIPLFFSAIPLYTISDLALENVKQTARPVRPYQAASAGKRNPHPAPPGGPPRVVNDLQLNLFSDGGIAANFPIHFFDSWLPSRPTFGINLTAMPPAARGPDTSTVRRSFLSALLGPGGADEAARPVAAPAAPDCAPAVILPEPGQVLPPEWRPITGLPGFLLQALATARENHDNVQSLLPGFRERIIDVRFSDDEGGMNLLMAPQTIAGIARKGQLAGAKLCADFQFEPHKWIRFLGVMSQLELQLEQLRLHFDSGDYEKLLLTELGAGSTFPYLRGHDPRWGRDACLRARQLLEVVERWRGDGNPPDPPAPARAPHHRPMDACGRPPGAPELRFFNHYPAERDENPKPRSVLRVTPEV